jgi:hypothetical protein
MSQEGHEVLELWRYRGDRLSGWKWESITLTPQEKQKAYWNAHYEAVRLLEKIGIKWPTKRRIPTFYLRNKILRKYKDAPQEVIRDIIYTLDVMVKMRIEGAEPSHSPKGIYT